MDAKGLTRVVDILSFGLKYKRPQESDFVEKLISDTRRAATEIQEAIDNPRTRSAHRKKAKQILSEIIDMLKARVDHR